jgi:hypothetical protein
MSLIVVVVVDSVIVIVGATERGRFSLVLFCSGLFDDALSLLDNRVAWSQCFSISLPETDIYSLQENLVR